MYSIDTELQELIKEYKEKDSEFKVEKLEGI